MEVIIFIVVLVVLILVHELGHFIVAKLTGMRVDEFGIGYPPRALTIAKIHGTEYTLNWLPFGGFVRIYGEDGLEDSDESPEVAKTAPKDSFLSKPRILQALVLIAGIAMNLVFAYVLLTATLVMGTQQELKLGEVATTKDATIVFSSVRPGLPADKAGFMVGDKIKNATTTSSAATINYSGNDPAALATLITQDTNGSPMTFLVDRNGKLLTLTATPQKGVVANDPNRPGLGVAISAVGTVKTPLIEAPMQGLIFTWNVTEETAVAFYNFFKGIVLFKANLSEVSGPIGIANAVGQASANGIAALLTLTALISINLALVNLIPIPALDGGRLLFVIIEAVIRRPIHPKVAERVNAVGFLLLILLMVVVSAHDIWTLFT